MAYATTKSEIVNDVSVKVTFTVDNKEFEQVFAGMTPIEKVKEALLHRAKQIEAAKKLNNELQEIIAVAENIKVQ